MSILFWSVIAAAFIGPGTVTTAASAGAGYGTALLWALGFSTVACIVLQEAAGRLTLLSGHTLGEALRLRFPRGLGRVAVLVVVGGAVLIGCAAYEAGNILGGVAGAQLVLDLPRWLLTLVCGGIAATLLWFNAPGTVARVLGFVVAVMGVSFLGMAAAVRPAAAELLRGLLLPTLPAGAGLLALGLVGTTVVPYNLFLGSGLARDQALGDFRLGLGVAVGLGGLISMGVLVVGTVVEPPFGYEALSAAIAEATGSWGRLVFAVGLFSAGLSSAVTAPLAAALTARSLSGSGDWSESGWRYRSVWGAVLLAGVVFGVTEVRPVPAIIVAQALNGVVLPGVACFLLLAVNDRRLMGAAGVNGAGSNLAMAVVTLVALALGTLGVVRAFVAVLEPVFGVPAPSAAQLRWIVAGVALSVGVPLARIVRHRRGR